MIVGISGGGVDEVGIVTDVVGIGIADVVAVLDAGICYRKGVVPVIAVAPDDTVADGRGAAPGVV